MAMTWQHTWQTHLSAQQRRSVAHEARVASFRYATPSEGRYKRFVADVSEVRRAGQDHRVGWCLDAAFARATAPRPLFAPPARPPWLDQLKVLGCMLGATVRQLVDMVACAVGVLVGLARYGAPVAQWGKLRLDADPQALQRGIERCLRDQVARHVDAHPLAPGALAYQFHIDHDRQRITLGDARWDEGTSFIDKRAQLLEFCDHDPHWAQNVSLILNQFPANCAFETLGVAGRMRLNNLGVGSWTHHSTQASTDADASAHQATRDGDAVVVRANCHQRLSSLMVGPPAADGGIDFSQLDPVLCAGYVRYQVQLKVPRPEKGAAEAFHVTRFTMRSRVQEPILGS